MKVEVEDGMLEGDLHSLRTVPLQFRAEFGTESLGSGI